MTEYDLPPVSCSQGGFAYNGAHIEYWKARALKAESGTPAQGAKDQVQDTWFVGGHDLKAMSGSVESDRIIQLHFRRKATDADRKWLLEAINAKIVADGAAFPSTESGGGK